MHRLGLVQGRDLLAERRRVDYKYIYRGGEEVDPSTEPAVRILYSDLANSGPSHHSHDDKGPHNYVCRVLPRNYRRAGQLAPPGQTVRPNLSFLVS